MNLAPDRCFSDNTHKKRKESKRRWVAKNVEKMAREHERYREQRKQWRLDHPEEARKQNTENVRRHRIKKRIMKAVMKAEKERKKLKRRKGVQKPIVYENKDTYLMFPCCHACMVRDMNRIYTSVPAGHASVSGNTITVDDNRFIYFVDINSRLQDVCGLEIKGYWVCDNYSLSRKVTEYFNSHMR